MSTMYRPVAAAVALTMLTALLTRPALAGTPECFPREGHCVRVVVNGQPSVPVTRDTRKALGNFESQTHYADDTEYEVADPIRGALDIQVAPVPGSEEFLGQAHNLDVKVIPLQVVEVDTERRQTVDETVRIGGSPAVTETDFLVDNRLPPGNYLLRVKLLGTDNWDRQTLLLRVAE